MTHASRALGALATSLLAGLALAGPASAAPDRNTSFAAAGTFTWSGTGNGWYTTTDIYDVVPCQAGNDCDDTLIEVKVPGTLTVTTTGDATNVDSDLFLYESDASGGANTLLKESAVATPTPNETVSAELEPGFYLARSAYAVALAGTINGEAKFEPLAGAPPAGGSGGTPTPANAKPTATIAAVAKAAKASKLKSFKGTAKDTDGTVTRVELGILKLKGSKCQSLQGSGAFKSQSNGCAAPNAFLTAKGTSKWTFKLKKKLAPGKYAVFARAIDDKGEPSEKLAKKTFTVKK
jgi:hypothetical protein